MSIKGPLLALINRAPAYGYELHALLETALGEPWSINIGQVYSTLSRLERDGLIKHCFIADNGDSERTVYEITASGKTELNRWLREPVSRQDWLRDEFFSKLLLSLQVDDVLIGDVIQSQRRRLLKEMHDLIQIRTEIDAEKELPWLLILEFAIIHLEADLKWLELSETRLDELREMPAPHFESRTRGRPPSGHPP